MSKNILLFPSLNDDLIGRIRFQKTKYSFFYTDNDNLERELQDEPVEAMSSIYCIKDESGEWDQDNNDFCLRRKYCLRTFQCLFGPSGVACKDAILGLAIIWTSSDSKQRGVIPVGTFSYRDQILDVKVEYKYEKAQLRGLVNFTTVLYIAKSGTPENDEMHLANTNGYLLGEFETFTIKLDGKGSTFPVFEVSEPNQPLWYIKCDWIDPTVDALADSISINLNTAHKSYKYIDRAQRTFNSQLLAEIMASAISIIIEKLRASAYWNQIIENDTLEEGSVGQAVYYFYKTLEWDLTTPETVSLSARKFFDQRM